MSAPTPTTNTADQRRKARSLGRLLRWCNNTRALLQNRSLSERRNMDLNIPRVIVIGDQTSGKSSFLNGLIERAILPTGTNTTTVQPTEIQIDFSESNEEWYCQFVPWKPGDTLSSIEVDGEKKYTNPIEVRNEIARLQQESVRVVHPNAQPNVVQFVDIPIVLKIFKRECFPVTLVDLPGLVAGNGTDAQNTLSIAMKYINTPVPPVVCLIVKGTNDLDNSTALKGVVISQLLNNEAKAKKVVGVMTHCDILNSERATLNMSILQNPGQRAEHLSHNGYYLTCQNNEIQSILRCLPPLEPNLRARIGINAVERTLSSLLGNELVHQIPTIISNIQRYSNDIERKLSSINAPFSSNDIESKKRYIQDQLKIFESDIKLCIFGDAGPVMLNFPLPPLGGRPDSGKFKNTLNSLINVLQSEYNTVVAFTGVDREIDEACTRNFIHGCTSAARNFVIGLKESLITLLTQRIGHYFSDYHYDFTDVCYAIINTQVDKLYREALKENSPLIVSIKSMCGDIGIRDISRWSNNLFSQGQLLGTTSFECMKRITWIIIVLPGIENSLYTLRNDLIIQENLQRLRESEDIVCERQFLIEEVQRLNEIIGVGDHKIREVQRLLQEIIS